MFGICNLSVVPVRKEPADRSEMVNQLLFGEHFEVLERKKQWTRIRTTHDDYTGWIDTKQFTEIAPEDFNKLNKSASHLVAELVHFIRVNDQLIPLLLGSTLPFFDGYAFRIGAKEYTYEGMVRNADKFLSKKSIVENALLYLNAPYLWGGRSPFGIDCSGFTQMAYLLSGQRIRRDAYQQAEQGRTLNFPSEAEPGDLAFFANEEGKISHTGIMLEDGKIIHASGKVRIDMIDHQGIYNAEMGQYTHAFRLIKRIV